MIECPVPGGFFDCPCCNIEGQCTLQNPREECDDYCTVMVDDEDEDC